MAAKRFLATHCQPAIPYEARARCAATNLQTWLIGALDTSITGSLRAAFATLILSKATCKPAAVLESAMAAPASYISSAAVPSQAVSVQLLKLTVGYA